MNNLGFGIVLEPLDQKSHDEDDQDTIRRYSEISESAIAAPAILSAWQSIQNDALSKSVRRLAESMLKTPDDKAKVSDDTRFMNDITREEFSAKIETIEAKMDARVESVSAKIEGFLSAQAERDKRLDSVLAQIGKDNGDTKTGISSMKTTLIVTAVSTVLAIVLGVAGFNTALTSNMLSAFQLGKSTQTSTSEAVAPEAPKIPPVPASPPPAKSGS